MLESTLIKKKEWERQKTIRLQTARRLKKVQNIEGEIWYDIPRYVGYYQISNFFRIKSLSRWAVYGKYNKNHKKFIGEKLRSPSKPKNHYLHFIFHINGIKKTELLHRLIGEVFIPNTNNFPEINHKNGNKTDYRIENLEWCTRSQNQRHALDTGLVNPAFGEAHYRARLSSKQIIEIRKKYIPRIYSTRMLANEYGVNQSHISMIINKIHRKHG